MHTELVYILRKQKIFDTVFSLGDVFYWGYIFMRFLLLNTFASHKGENAKILGVFLVLKICKPWHQHYYCDEYLKPLFVLYVCAYNRKS